MSPTYSPDWQIVIPLGIVLILCAASLIFGWKAEWKRAQMIPFVILAGGAIALAAVLGVTTASIEVSGQVLEVDTHGDGSRENDFSSLKVEGVNGVGLVVMRSEIPSIAQGDSVELECDAISNDVYLCTGTVMKPVTVTG